MKKDTFIKGALVSTICIVLSKILGIVYVIPFNAIIGTKGGALYGYAYNIYVLFLQLSTVGIPLAISKIVSEYSALEYNDLKRRTYKMSLIITSIMAILSSIILYIFARDIAFLIIGDIKGGNTIEDIIFVIRISSSVIFFATLLSSIRGYLQGQKFIKNSSISQVIEQFVRIIIIIFGSYIFMKLYGVKEAVGIAISGATIGAIFALIYLYLKGKKELKLTDKNYILKEEEKKVTNKQIALKLIKSTIPFVILSVIVSLYVSIDMVTVIKTLVNKLNFSANDAEYIMSCISTWGAKLNIIVTSISSGIVVSLLPNIASDFAMKKYDEIGNKTKKTLEIILVIVIPMVAGLSLLATPVWNIFYGNNILGANVFKYSIFMAIFSGLFININVIMQSTDRYFKVYLSLISGLLFKLIMNIPLILLFSKLGLPAYYGNITATILGYIISITISIIDLKKTFNIKFKSTLKTIVTSIIATIIMSIIIKLIQIYIPINDLSKLNSMLVIILYAIIGIIIYGLIMFKTGIINKVFGGKKWNLKK